MRTVLRYLLHTFSFEFNHKGTKYYFKIFMGVQSVYGKLNQFRLVK
jgi:hypothetical protein